MICKQPYTWGVTPNGEKVTCYTLTCGDLRAEILDMGGIVHSLYVPDKNKEMHDVMLGFNTVEEYLNSDTYFGALIGRYCNRIANGRFELDGKEYLLETNNGKNNLHSGKNGFHQYIFEADWSEQAPNKLVLKGRDEHLNQGFPGNFEVVITYTLFEDALDIAYGGLTDATTPVNMTWHGYFNLNGHDSGNILDHNLQIMADKYTPFADENMIPSGEQAMVEGTPFDFREGKAIGKDIEVAHPQLKIAGGYDHNYVFNKSEMDDAVVKVVGSKSGITMTVHTERPCMQLYTGNFITTQKGKRDATYEHRQGFCLETQTYPNAVNCKEFPSDILCPGGIYYTRTRYIFS